MAGLDPSNNLTTSYTYFDVCNFAVLQQKTIFRFMSMVRWLSKYFRAHANNRTEGYTENNTKHDNMSL